MQVKTGLCHILSRFEVAPCKDTPVPVAFDAKSFLLAISGEMPLSFKRIQQ
jgi:cytochrome P450 family 6